MKQYKLLWFLCLLICVSLACNLPVLTNDWGVTSVTVTPHIGSGSFSAAVVVKAYTNGKYTLRCYISADNGDVVVFGPKTVQHTDTRKGTYYDYYSESFIFPYTVLGTHSLVCATNNNNSTAYSDDFVVVSAAAFTPTPTSTDAPTPTFTPTATPTKPTTLTLNGTFKLPEEKITCDDGTQFTDPARAISGTLVLNVDYTTGQASATLQGTGQGTTPMCGHSQLATDTWTINGAFNNGTVDSSTNALALTGDVTYTVESSCQVIDEANGGACIAGSQTHTANMTINGSIDPAQSKGSGQIQWTGSKTWGTWQAAP